MSILKGDMCRFELNGLTFYGTVISVVNDVYLVSHNNYSTGEPTTTQLTIDKITKIGNG